MAVSLQYGFKTMKLFPAGDMPRSYVKDLKGPFDDTNYVAIGGVTPENIPEFRKAGCLFGKLLFLLKRLFNFRFCVLHLLFQRSQGLFTGGKAGGERFKHIFHALNVAVNIAAEFHGVG